ncbi:MAG TPA: NADPH-dependent FMN reductase, partial [Puia sp.]|nr:NADPH-dependent FMN reductase [Puia sp.]
MNSFLCLFIMMEHLPKILCIPGSIRNDSSSFALIRAIPQLVKNPIEFILFDGLADLPHFDGSEPAPENVARFRSLIAASDGVIICSPEYAFGIPGSLKNALDWTVSSGEFDQKPVAIITASSQGEKAHAALLLV